MLGGVMSGGCDCNGPNLEDYYRYGGVMSGGAKKKKATHPTKYNRDVAAYMTKHHVSLAKAAKAVAAINRKKKAKKPKKTYRKKRGGYSDEILRMFGSALPLYETEESHESNMLAKREEDKKPPGNIS